MPDPARRASPIISLRACAYPYRRTGIPPIKSGAGFRRDMDRWSRARLCCSAHQSPLEIGTIPAHLHDRAALGELTVLQREPRARALEQRLGDEKAEPEPGVLVGGALAPAAAGDERLAHAVHDIRRKARTVVVDRDPDLVAAPVGLDLHPLAREINRVLDQVAEPVHDRRIARDLRLVAAVLRHCHRDGDAEVAMRRYHLLEQGGQLHALERLAGAGQLAELAENVGAALHLLARPRDGL